MEGGTRLEMQESLLEERVTYHHVSGSFWTYLRDLLSRRNNSIINLFGLIHACPSWTYLRFINGPTRHVFTYKVIIGLIASKKGCNNNFVCFSWAKKLILQYCTKVTFTLFSN